MAISARNQLSATVEQIQTGAVNDIISLKLGSDTLTAVITQGSTQKLGLAVGSEVIAIFKAPSVILATGDELLLSSRNQLQGSVSALTEGAVNTEVSITTAGGATLTAIITNQSRQNLALSVGSSVTALIKASDIVIGVRR